MSFFRLNGATRHALLAFSSYTEKCYANFVSIKNSLVGWISSLRLLVHLKSYKAFHWLLMPTTGRLSKFRLSVRQLSSYTEKFYANFVSIKNYLVGWISSLRLLVHLKSYKAFHWLLMPTTGRLSKFKLSVRQLLPTNVTPKPRKY